MALSFVGSSYSGGTQTGTAPSGTPAQNDIYIAVVFGGEAVTITAPAGWTILDQLTSTAQMVALCYIVRGASEPAFNWSGFASANNCSIEILAYRGGDTTTPVEPLSQYPGSRAVVLNSGDTTPDSPSVTTRVDKSFLFISISDGAADPGSITFPTHTPTFNSRFNKPSADWFAGGDCNITPTATTGVQTWTIGNTVNTLGGTVAIRPAGGAAAATPTGIFQTTNQFWGS